MVIIIIPCIMLIGGVRHLPSLVGLPYFAFILNSTTHKQEENSSHNDILTLQYRYIQMTCPLQSYTQVFKRIKILI